MHREVVIARVVDAHGQKRVWFSRADGRMITYHTSETWLYESEFHPRFTRIP